MIICLTKQLSFEKLTKILLIIQSRLVHSEQYILIMEQTITIFIDDIDYKRTIDCDWCYLSKIQNPIESCESIDHNTSLDSRILSDPIANPPQFRCLKHFRVYQKIEDCELSPIDPTRSSEIQETDKMTQGHMFYSGLFLTVDYPDESESKSQESEINFEQRLHNLRKTFIPFHQEDVWDADENVKLLQDFGSKIAMTNLIASTGTVVNTKEEHVEDQHVEDQKNTSFVPNHFNLSLKPQIISVYASPKMSVSHCVSSVPNFTSQNIYNIYVHMALISSNSANSNTKMFHIPERCVRMDSLVKKVLNHVRNACNDESYAFNVLVSRDTMTKASYDDYDTRLYETMDYLPLLQDVNRTLLRRLCDRIYDKFRASGINNTVYGSQADFCSICVIQNPDVARTMRMPYSDLCKTYGVPSQSVYLDPV